MMQKQQTRRGCSREGFGLLEVVIGAAILLLVISGVSTTYSILLRAGRLSVGNVQAEYLLAEGGEAALMMAAENWTSFAALSVDSPYYLTFTAPLWSTTGTASLIDGKFERTITIGRVYRDSNGDIAGGGTEDELARKVSVAVSWFSETATTTKTLTLYVFDQS